MAAKVISIFNGKGGVGKTTTTVELAYELAQSAKTLLVDLDGQGDSSGHITGQKHKAGIYDLLIDESDDGGPPPKRWRSLIASPKGDWGNLAVLPATEKLSGLAIDIKDRVQREYILDGILEHARSFFDYIIIDNPTVVDIRTVNSLVASDYFLIPTDISQYSFEGVQKALKYAAFIKKRLNPELELLAVVGTSYAKGGSRAIRQIKEAMEKESFDKFWGTIPDSVRIVEAQRRNLSVQKVEPEASVALQYKKLASFIKETTQHGHD